MAGITQEIPNYGVGGISQQPDQLKIPGQVKDAVNVVPDVIYGLYKRPGAERVGVTKLPNVQANGSYFHYHRDDEEGHYIGQVASDGKIRMWTCQDIHNASGTKVNSAGDEIFVHYDTVSGAYTQSNYSGADSDHTSITSYLTPSSATATEDIQALTINDTTFLNNRTKTVGTTGTTDAYDHPKGRFAFVDLLRTENGRQYGINLYSEETTTTRTRATRIQITDDDLYTGGGSGSCHGIGTQVFTVTAAGSYTSTPESIEVKNSSGTLVTSGKSDLIFRLTVN